MQAASAVSSQIASLAEVRQLLLPIRLSRSTVLVPRSMCLWWTGESIDRSVEEGLQSVDGHVQPSGPSPCARLGTHVRAIDIGRVPYLEIINRMAGLTGPGCLIMTGPSCWCAAILCWVLALLAFLLQIGSTPGTVLGR